MRLVVHGGAGGTPDEPAARAAVLEEAADEGAAAATPLDAVEAAIRRLESSPRFNAGVGAARQADGDARTDAGVMTDDRTVGAACDMAGVEHAVTVARAVHEETPHVLLAGEGARSFAASVGVETDVDLTTPESRERYDAADPPADPAARRAWVRERFGGHDTVGAVAADGDGYAAATSTGGRWFAMAGRVGDVPQTGSGFYCAPAGGASATGAGEDIARTTLARRAVGHLEAGRDAETAASLALEEFAELTGSTAGLIVLGAEGAGEAFNSNGMQTARR